MSIQKMGQGMILITCILSLGMLTLLFSEVQDQQHNPNQSPNSLTTQDATLVELKRNRQGHYVTNGQINYQQVEFLLDTGATDVVIGEQIARRLGLKKGLPTRAITANGTITVYATSIDQLSIGAINLYNIRASINPAMHADSILLGMSALKQVEFVQKGSSLTLRQVF